MIQVLPHNDSPPVCVEDKVEHRRFLEERDTKVRSAVQALHALRNRKPDADVDGGIATLREAPAAEIPSQFLESPKRAPLDADGRPRASGSRKSVSANRSTAVVRHESASPRGTFQVPLHRPLSLSWEVQHEKALLDGTYKPAASSTSKSRLSTLFSQSHGKPLTEEEKAALGFIAPPPDNRRKEVEEKRKETVAPPRPTTTTSKAQWNEPKKIPNLQKKVSATFVPSCVEVSTSAMRERAELQTTKKQELQKKGSKKGFR